MVPKPWKGGGTPHRLRDPTPGQGNLKWVGISKPGAPKFGWPRPFYTQKGPPGAPGKDWRIL